jgi:L-seryl-tRNA(Ser) seleniumtransferase
MGTYTRISGSRALPQVLAAMAAASDGYVDMEELMERVGERLAALTGAEWGYITSGAAAALVQLTAAAIAGADPERMVRLPDTAGMRNEVVMQAAHRYGYDWCMRAAGGRLVTVRTRAELAAALGERTALVAVTGDLEADSTIPVAEMIAAAHAHGVPAMVDAAAQRPDVPNRYLAMDADAVIYSGGKCLRGPQASGLVLGRRALLWAAFLHSAPHHSLGRAMKAGKEEIMGLLAAVEAWLAGRDHAAEWRMWEGYLSRIRAAVSDLPGVRTAIEVPGLYNVAPTLAVAWDAALLGTDGEQVRRELLAGEPRIAVLPLDGGLRVMPYMMEAGEDEIVARRLREVLSPRRPAVAAPGEQSPAADLTGDWGLAIQFLRGEGRYTMALAQDGAILTGRYRSPFDCAGLAGQVSGDGVRWAVTLGYESNRVRYAFEGRVLGQEMAGRVELGEYGRAEWRAWRE